MGCRCVAKTERNSQKVNQKLSLLPTVYKKKSSLLYPVMIYDFTDLQSLELCCCDENPVRAI